MKKIYICSRLTTYRDIDGNIISRQENILRAKRLCREVAMQGDIPICPHIYFTQFMDDDIEEERKLALQFNKRLIDGCDEMWVDNHDGISEGMQEELDYAKDQLIEIVYMEIK